MAKKKTKSDTSVSNESAPTKVEDSPKTNETKEESAKDTPKIITWKDFIVTFIIFFLIFGVVGYMRGRTKRNEPLRFYIDSQAYLRIAKETDGKQTIVYQCNDRNLFTWDVENNQLHNDRVGIKLPEATEYTPAIFKNEILITAFLSGGGVASIFTAKELLTVAGSGEGAKLTNNGYIKLIVTAILASISGYEVGYRIALAENADCNDIRYDSFLKNKEIWTDGVDIQPGLERRIWELQKQRIEQTAPLTDCKTNDAQIKLIQDENLGKAKVDYFNLKKSEATIVGSDLKSTHFDVLKKFEDAIDDFNKNCGG